MSKLMVFLIILVMIATLAAMIYMIVDANGGAEIVDIYYETGVKAIDSRFTIPDTYELLYRTSYSSGQSVDRWLTVSKEDYLSWEAEK